MTKGNVQYAGLNYPFLNNIGDHIQSLAAERLIPEVSERFERDRLRHISAANKTIVVMNGWFSHRPMDCFPVSRNILPLYFGFHVTNCNNTWSYLLGSAECMEQFRSFGPVGCRDQYTAMKLREAGIDTFYSKCLTLTFPRRLSKPSRGWNVIVDVPIALPPFIEDRSIRISHAVSSHLSESSKRRHAQDLLAFYRDNAAQVITTRLHCALPCLSMGIPVIFLGSNLDYRTSIVKDLAMPIYDLGSRRQDLSIKNIWNTIKWYPEEPDIEQEKISIIKSFNDHLSRCIEYFKY